MTHNNVRNGKVCGGAVRQMANDETVRHTAMLVDNEKVGDVVGAARVHQLVELVAAAVQPLRPGKQQLQLLLIVG